VLAVISTEHFLDNKYIMPSGEGVNQAKLKIDIYQFGDKATNPTHPIIYCYNR
jgi:hypothetical protein